MEKLLSDIQSKCGIDRKQAEIACGSLLCFLAARLPSPVMGRIKDALQSAAQSDLPHQSEEVVDKYC